MKTVIKILGEPDQKREIGNNAVWDYGVKIVGFKNEKLSVWSGYAEDDPRFFPERVSKGCDKGDVEHILGKPIHDGGDYWKYGLGEVVSFKNGKVVEWGGFAPDNASFTVPINKGQATTKSTPTASGNHSSHTYAGSNTRPKLSDGDYTTHTGPRGGKYHYSATGKKVYHKRR